MAAMGHERVLPNWLARTHRTSGAPVNAGLVQVGFNALVVGIAALAGANPYLGLGSTAISLGSVGLIVLQTLASISVIAYFVKNRNGRHWWRTFLAPLIGAAGLVWGLVLVLQKFSLLTGSTSQWVARLPWVVAIAAVAGIAWAAWLRSNRPTVYANLGAGLDEVHEENHSVHEHHASEAALELL
jgi:amino acid transporter